MRDFGAAAIEWWSELPDLTCNNHLYLRRNPVHDHPIRKPFSVCVQLIIVDGSFCKLRRLQVSIQRLFIPDRCSFKKWQMIHVDFTRKPPLQASTMLHLGYVVRSLAIIFARIAIASKT